MRSYSTKPSPRRTGRLISTIIFGALLTVGGWFWGNTYVAGTMNLSALVDIGDLEAVRYVARWDRKQLNRAAPIRELRRNGHGPDLETVRYEPLQIALRNGHPETAKLLLQLGAELGPQKTDEQGRTRLHRAVLDNKPAAARFLLEAGSPPNTVDRNGRTPLLDAAAAGRAVLVRLLLDHQADPGVKDRTGKTALQLAFDAGHTNVVKLLIERGCEQGLEIRNATAALRRAVLDDDAAMVDLLLRNGANVSQPDATGRTLLFQARSAAVARSLLHAGAKADAVDRDGRTPLHLTASAAVADVLLEAGADPRAGDKKGITPICLAAQDGRSEVVKTLIRAGVDVNTLNEQGAGVMDYAARAGRTGVIQVLLEAGARLDVGAPLDHAAANGHAAAVKLLLENGADSGRIWPLQSAIKGNHEEVVLLLLRAGAPPKLTLGWDRSTPLHWAARRGNMEILRLLLQHSDLDVNARDKYHRTPLHYATKTEVVKALIEAGAKVRVQDLARDVTPLHDAARRGNLDVVKLLLAAGADPNARTEDGKTPLDLAEIEGHDDVVLYLRNHKGKKATTIAGPEEVLRKENVLPEPLIPKRSNTRKKRR